MRRFVDRRRIQPIRLVEILFRLGIRDLSKLYLEYVNTYGLFAWVDYGAGGGVRYLMK